MAEVASAGNTYHEYKRLQLTYPPFLLYTGFLGFVKGFVKGTIGKSATSEISEDFLWQKLIKQDFGRAFSTQRT